MATDLLLDLTRRYCEPHRHYHDLRHVAGMLVQGRAFPLDEAQVWAVWYHDAIYAPRSKTNEEDSAALAVAQLTAAGKPPELVRRVERMVLDTKSHTPSTPDAAAVVDLDLASLALPWPEFAANTEAIRREYTHLGDAEFTAGRRAFFQRMLAQPRLYWTPWGAQLEPLARRNLERAAAG